ncbi:MAG: hypothetical protein JRD71_02630 [Deltaproteobacteria bacterium]|nr:hypothetical protein [Deltaproteobacteria bacterium]
MEKAEKEKKCDENSEIVSEQKAQRQKAPVFAFGYAEAGKGRRQFQRKDIIILVSW